MKTTYSVMINGSISVADTSHKDACNVFSQVFHANDKSKHMVMMEHTKDAQGNLLSSTVVLQVSGRPNLKAIKAMEASK